MSILQSIVFLLAFSGTVYFMGRLVTWTVFKVNPENCKREFTRKEILKANIVMVISKYLVFSIAGTLGLIIFLYSMMMC